MSPPPTVVALAKATHLGPTVAVTTFATALSVAGGRGSTSWLVAAAVGAGQCSIGWANDWVDAARDRAVGRTDKPVATGELPVATVRMAALGAAAACIPLSLASGLLAGTLHIAAVALGWAYDLGLKATAVSVLPYAGAFGLLPVFVALGLPAGGRVVWWVPATGALLGAGAHFANALPDLADDAATGVRGLPHRLGAIGSAVAAALLLGAGLALVGLAPDGAAGRLQVIALVVGGACATAGVAAALGGRPRATFPLAIGAAAAAVVATVSVGAQLSG